MKGIRAAAGSNVGKVRDTNQDNFYLNGKYNAGTDCPNVFEESHELGGTGVYAVFDGMGGEVLGELAAMLGASVLQKYDNIQKRNEQYEFEKMINEYVQDANRQICGKINENGGQRIGTTMTLLYVNENHCRVVNLGDSKAFRVNGDVMEQLSEDHTQAQLLVKIGVLSKEASKNHPQSSRLTQHLGIFEEEMIIKPHMSEEFEIVNGDRFVLCSDGLSNMVTEEAMVEILKKHSDAKDAVECLIDTALANGGKDNVTVMVVEYLPV